MANKSGERLTDHLSPTNQKLFRSLPQSLVKEFDTALDLRRGGDERYGGLNRYMTQTNYGHTTNMLRRIHYIDNRYPYITEGLSPQDKDDAEIMITVHDIGEAHPKVKDVPSTGPERESEEGQRRKRYEPKFGYIFLGKIPDPIFRHRAQDNYKRVIAKDYRDPLAQIVQITDKDEGTFWGGLEGIYSQYPRFGYSEPPEILIEILEENLVKFAVPFALLAPHLGKRGREQLDMFANEELDRIEAAGYNQSIRLTRKFISEAISYPVQNHGLQPFYIKSVRDLAIAS